MSTTTHLWETSNGKKIPVQMLPDDHLRQAYRMCWIVVYYYELEKKPRNNVGQYRPEVLANMTIDEAIAARLKENWGIEMPIEKATKFATILEAEVQRRGKRFKRPEAGKIFQYLNSREQSKNFMRDGYYTITSPPVLRVRNDP